MKVSVLNEDETLALLSGHEDILKREIQREADHLKILSCPKCRSGEITKEIDVKRPFGGNPLANWNARCGDCQCLFSPGTGIIIEG